MTAQRKEEIKKGLWNWIDTNKGPLTTVMAFIGLSYQVGKDPARYTLRKVNGFVDTVYLTAGAVRQLETKVAKYEVDNTATDNRQDTLITRLLTLNTKQK